LLRTLYSEALSIEWLNLRLWDGWTC
jgi:hypothetical protein